MSKQRKRRSKSNTVSKDARQVSAKQAAKKSTKARQRITKEQAADLTARLNNEFSAVPMLSEKVRSQTCSTSYTDHILEPSTAPTSGNNHRISFARTGRDDTGAGRRHANVIIDSPTS